MRTLKALTLVTALATVLSTAHLAAAAELETSELAGVVNDVTVTQGSSAPFNVDVSATGSIDCSVTSANPATAKVDTQFSISGGGSVTGTDFSSDLNFFASGTPCSGNNPITWTGAPTHYTVAASVNAAATTPVGVYNLTLSVAAGTTQVTNPNQQGGKLADTSATTIRFRVVAPSDTTPPAITKTVTGTLGTNGWYTSDVTVAWGVVDPESAVVIDSGCGTQNFTNETIGVTSSCQAHSAGGSSTDSVTLKIDKTGPLAALFVTEGTLGSNGWYTSAVTVHTSGSDAISDNVSCTPDQLQTAETAGTDFHGSCTNDAGLTGDAEALSIKLDETPPIIDVTFAPPRNADGWNRTDVLVSYSCQDGLSGVDTSYNSPPYAAGCPSDDLASSEGLTSFVNRSARDLAGNLALVSPSVRIDKHAPTISQGAIDGTVGAYGWYTSDVTVHFTAFDGLSGLKDGGDAAFTLTAAGEGPSVSTGSRDVYDRADNVATAGSLNFQIDKHAPAIVCGAADGAWHQTDVSIVCSASDSGGSDLADSADASFSLSTNVSPGTDDPDATTGSHQVCDLAGNCATAGPISGNKVDKKAPTVSCGSPDGMWHADNVNIACAASDAGSDLANDADASFSLATAVPDGSETELAFTGIRAVFDVAGNSTQAGPIGPNKIDRKGPSITISSPSPGPYVLNGSVASSYGCADGGSGLATCVGTVPSGSDVDTSSVGSKTFTVNATDNLGNPSSSNVGYSVQYSTGLCLGSYGHRVLQPMNPDGSSVFKRGSTVPVKFRVCDALGNSINTPGLVTGSGAPLLLYKTGGAGGVDEAVYSNTPDPAFRWDPNDRQWIFNQSTKNLIAGVVYTYRIPLNDGTYIDYTFGVK